MKHLEYWPLRLPQDQKKAHCPKCGALTTHEVKSHDGAPDACRLVCSEDPTHWGSDWDEKTWEGRIIE